MSVRNPNHPRTRARVLNRATRRATRRGNADAAWMAALAAGMTGYRP